MSLGMDHCLLRSGASENFVIKSDLMRNYGDGRSGFVGDAAASGVGGFGGAAYHLIEAGARLSVGTGAPASIK